MAISEALLAFSRFERNRVTNPALGEPAGRRFLEGYASDEAQYRTLLEAGATSAQAYGLRPGVALSAE